MQRALRPSESLPRALATTVARFLDEYLGARVPLAGRDAELRQLDAWLDDATRPVALVVSEAGCGKSALLARWAEQRVAQGTRLVFVPISLRFATALRGPAWKLVAHGLAAALGRALPEAQDAAALRAECHAALAGAAAVVVVVDGLDEAAGWSWNDLALPVTGAVKLLVSARTAPGVDAAAWRTRLGVGDGVGIERCMTMTLGPLDHDAVRALLATAAGLDAPELAAEVTRLSQGDPLLVRLYVEAVMPGGPLAEQAAWLGASDLPRTPPGLDGWFARWWDQVEDPWRGDMWVATAVGAVLDVLATALAPLPRADLDALVARIVSATPQAVTVALRRLRPLLAGDRRDGPFVLGHPRLRYFRLDAMTERDRARLRGVFVAYGEAQLRELAAGTRAPGDASPYLVQHLGVHVTLDGDDPRAAWRLIVPAWQRAWEALDGTFDGFVADVHRAGELAARAVIGDDDALRAEAVEVVARCALVISSVASLTYRLPSNLVGYLIEEAIWSPAVALSRAQRPGGGFASEALRALTPHLDLALARDAMAVCVRHARHVHDLPDAEGVAALVVRLAALAGDAEAVAALARLPANVRAMVAAIAWRQLPRAMWPTLAAAVRDGAAAVSHCSYAASTVFAALPILEDPALRAALIAQAQDRLYDEDFGLDNEHAAQLAAAGDWETGWNEAQRTSATYPRAQMLAFVAPFMPAARRDEAYRQWFDAFRKERASVSLRIPGGLPAEIRGELLGWARTQQAAPRAKALIALAYEDPAMRVEAIAAARAVTGTYGVGARRALIPALETADQRALALEVYELGLALLEQHGSELARDVGYWNRGPDDHEWAYMGRYREHAEVVVEALAPLAVEDRARRVRALFARFRRIDDRAQLVTAAVVAVEAAPAADQGEWLGRLCEWLGGAASAASAATAPISAGDQDAHALAALARLAARISDPRHAALAEAAWRGRITAGDRPAAEALAEVADALGANRDELQRDALDRWHQTAGNYNWSEVLRGLRPSLSPQVAERALATARAESFSEYALQALWPALPAAVRDEAGRDEIVRRCRRDLWHGHAFTLSELVPEIPGFGRAVAELIDREPRVWQRPALLAWCIAPLCRDGLIDRARDVHSKLAADPLAAWVGDVALATIDGVGLRDALARLPAVASAGHDPELRLDDAIGWALDALAPVGRVDDIAAAAAALPPDAWLTYARVLVRRGLDRLLTAQLTPARIAAIDPRWLRLGLAPARWSHLLSPASAGAMWAAMWRDVTGASGPSSLADRRTNAITSWITHLPLAVRAGDADTPLRLASLILELGDWLP